MKLKIEKGYEPTLPSIENPCEATAYEKELEVIHN